jgi:anti-sigma regulatory factor (Ser/Thr protein kinase)
MIAGFAVTAGWDLPVVDPSQVHAAVAMADAAVSHAGLTPADRAGCALIATELATNLARHARDGRLVVTATEPGPAAWVQLAAVDHGPGIPNVEAAMADGYSTANSLGGGLGACRRAATVFDLWTSTTGPRPASSVPAGRVTPGTGTVVIARMGHGAPSELHGSSSHIRVGGILAAQPGEQESGDAWGVTWDAGTITLVIMDGLGHGPEAAAAAANGLHEAAARAGADDPVTLLGRLDRRLLGGRGAVAAVARLSRHELAFGGVGNIGARLGPNGRSHGLVSSMGTLGLGQRLRPQATVTPWGAHSLFTAHTDGIRPSCDLSRYPGVTRHDLAVMAALIWRDAATRGDDAAIVITATAAELAAAEDAGGTVGRP